MVWRYTGKAEAVVQDFLLDCYLLGELSLLFGLLLVVLLQWAGSIFRWQENIITVVCAVLGVCLVCYDYTSMVSK